MSLAPSKLRGIIDGAPIFKMSLGKNARFRAEAIEKRSLIFSSELLFYRAVQDKDESEVERYGALVKSEQYPKAGAGVAAIRVWEGSIHTFESLPDPSLVIHWEADEDHLHWGISSSEIVSLRMEKNEYNQNVIVLGRPLIHGWQKTSLGGVPLSNIHPNARNLSINQATINRVVTDPDFFRAIILDRPTGYWESLPKWLDLAKKSGWKPKAQDKIYSSQRARRITGNVVEIVNQFEEDIARMASTAVHTAMYANGQYILKKIKDKDISFSRDELEEEVAFLLKESGETCALTGYKFHQNHPNKHLRPSLDRIDSSKGYISGNLQIVTRAANFFKSASDLDDWKLKEKAMIQMAISIQRRRDK